jgi:hypothetical protein
MNGTHRLGLGVALIAAAVLTGCGNDGGRTSTTTTTAGSVTGATGLGEAKVVLHGATTCDSCGPGQPGWAHDSGIAQLSITFDILRLYPQRSDSMGAPPDSARGGYPGGHGHGHGPGGPCFPDSAVFVETLVDPVSIDVLGLSTELGQLVTEAQVPAGSYGSLSLRVIAASAVTDSGAAVTVTVAAPDSLLRVLSTFVVADGQGTEIPVYIDLDRSVREHPPGSGQYVLTPVFFATEPSAPPHGGPGGGHGGGPGGGMGDSDLPPVGADPDSTGRDTGRGGYR